jgi:hypothetical protein
VTIRSKNLRCAKLIKDATKKKKNFLSTEFKKKTETLEPVRSSRGGLR